VLADGEAKRRMGGNAPGPVGGGESPRKMLGGGESPRRVEVGESPLTTRDATEGDAGASKRMLCAMGGGDSPRNDNVPVPMWLARADAMVLGRCQETVLLKVGGPRGPQLSPAGELPMPVGRRVPAADGRCSGSALDIVL
jgi:hypothetical protein